MNRRLFTAGSLSITLGAVIGNIRGQRAAVEASEVSHTPMVLVGEPGPELISLPQGAEVVAFDLLQGYYGLYTVRYAQVDGTILSLVYIDHENDIRFTIEIGAMSDQEREQFPGMIVYRRSVVQNSTSLEIYNFGTYFGGQRFLHDPAIRNQRVLHSFEHHLIGDWHANGPEYYPEWFSE